MRVYFDSSAFAKRYVDEAGTREVLAWCDQAAELALSVIAVPELISAFRRLMRGGRLDDPQYRQLKADLMADIADALICDTTPQVVQKSITALGAHPLRALDAIHAGAVLARAADAFISADGRQCIAGRHFGLRVLQL
jgi:uncharacterized protein